MGNPWKIIAGVKRETSILMSKKAGLFMVEKEMVYPVGICSDPRRHFGTASEKADLKKKKVWLIVG